MKVRDSMKSSFKIEPGNPKNTAVFDKEDTGLAEAIYTIFPPEAEDAVLFWGSEKIPLSYRYDISEMADDMIEMIHVLQRNSGEWSVDWPSNTFAANWVLKWSEDSVKIEAQWREEFSAAEYLRCNKVLEVGKKNFLEEWEKVINVLSANLTACGYSPENLSDMDLLIQAKDILA